jgi:Family of unknown function (DUF6134)
VTRAWSGYALLLAATPLLAANNTWTFRVSLDSREVGTHRFELRDVADGEELRSDATFNVKVLAISIWRYRHHATELWRGNCLRSLQSDTDTNGEKQRVNTRYDDCPMSFAYWNAGILHAHQLINSQTGVATPVIIRDLGSGSVDVYGKPQLAQHYQITGPQVSIDLWYMAGEWVALDADTEGGHRLHYRLN